MPATFIAVPCSPRLLFEPALLGSRALWRATFEQPAFESTRMRASLYVTALPTHPPPEIPLNDPPLRAMGSAQLRRPGTFFRFVIRKSAACHAHRPYEHGGGLRTSLSGGSTRNFAGFWPFSNTNSMNQQWSATARARAASATLRPFLRESSSQNRPARIIIALRGVFNSSRPEISSAKDSLSKERRLARDSLEPLQRVDPVSSRV